MMAGIIRHYLSVVLIAVVKNAIFPVIKLANPKRAGPIVPGTTILPFHVRANEARSG
jgi:hypothetical protein